MNWLSRLPLKTLLTLFAAVTLVMGLSLAVLGLLHHLQSIQHIDNPETKAWLFKNALLSTLVLGAGLTASLTLLAILIPRFIRPFALVSDTLAHMAQRDKTLHLQIPAVSHRELHDLTDSFNRLLSLVKARETALHQSLDLAQGITEAMRDGVAIIDRQGLISAPNRALQRILGTDALQGQPFAKFILDDTHNNNMAWLSQFGSPYQASYHQNVDTFWHTLRQTKTPLLVIQEGNWISFVNRAAEDLLACAPGSLIGKPLSALIQEKTEATQHLTALLSETDISSSDLGMLNLKPAQGEPLAMHTRAFLVSAYDHTCVILHFTHYDDDAHPITPHDLSHNQKEIMLLRHPESQHIPTLIAAAPLHDETGALTGFVITVKDMSELEMYKERQRTELMMLSQSRLSALGEVATGVAHEINQPLTFISATVQSIRRGIRKERLDTAHSLELLEESMRQIQRISNIIDHMRTFGRADMTNKTESVEVPTVINNALILLGARLRNHGITLNIQGGEGLPEVSSNSSELEQVFINLFTNAMDAFADTPQDRRNIHITLSAEIDWVSAVFEDTGSGMPDAVRERIFEPFYTTKPVGKGTGLGMSLILGIIQKYNGQIRCESTPGIGTRFIFQLPKFVCQTPKKKPTRCR